MSALRSVDFLLLKGFRRGPRKGIFMHTKLLAVADDRNGFEVRVTR